MTTYHISPTTGNPNRCTAQHRACPYGGQDKHYPSKEAAREAVELANEGDVIPSAVRKPSTPGPSDTWTIESVAANLDDAIVKQEAKVKAWKGKGKARSVEHLVKLRENRAVLNSSATMSVMAPETMSALSDQYRKDLEDVYNWSVMNQTKPSAKAYMAVTFANGFYDPVPAESEQHFKAMADEVLKRDLSMESDAAKAFQDSLNSKKEAAQKYRVVRAAVMDGESGIDYASRRTIANAVAAHAVSE